MVALQPEDVTDIDLRRATRGYDKAQVDRHLARVADAYALSLRRCEQLQELLRSLEDELDAAVGEAEASAREVARLIQRSPTTQAPPLETDKVLDKLEARLTRSENEREQALVDLRQMSEHASELGQLLQVLEAERVSTVIEPERIEEDPASATLMADLSTRLHEPSDLETI